MAILKNVILSDFYSFTFKLAYKIRSKVIIIFLDKIA